jgi:succinate dehydrogenase flavin-adding protein (antitoxin of CptAB toxin-antitoxin module)
MSDAVTAMRRVRYRLRRQGMAELDAWLAPLENVAMSRPDLVDEIERLLACEAPELLAMMHGEVACPALLAEWLECRR